MDDSGKTPGASTEGHSLDDTDGLPVRTVAFPDDAEVIDEKPTGGLRPKGVEMRREMTKEDKELANAGYEHLEAKPKKEGKDVDLEKVDIYEHQLPYTELSTTLQTSFDAKDPQASLGLSQEEAAARLVRDGRNVLTPPKKKSAFRKVASSSLVSLKFSDNAFFSTWIAFSPCSTSCSSSPVSSSTSC